MKSPISFIIAIVFSLCASKSIAQQSLLVKAGAYIVVQNGAVIYIKGGITLEDNSTLNNAGTITIARQNVDIADFSDLSANLNSYGSGKFVFNGTGIQNIRGGIFNKIAINNVAGVNILCDIKIDDSLALVSGSLSISGHKLILGGAVTGGGKLKGSNKSNLQINGAMGLIKFEQTSSSSRSLHDLTLSSGGSATLGDSLEVYGDIILTAASLDLSNKNLILKSNDLNTARIGNLTGSTLSNATNVTVERFIKLRAPGTGYGVGNNGRAYRLVTPTVNTGTSIKFNWMNNEMNTAIGVNVNSAAPGYGTQITGAGGNVNGFDVTQSNQSSLYFTANAVTPTYTAVGNTAGTLNALTGYFLFIRGDRSMMTTLPLADGMPTSSTTLRATGTIVQGQVSNFSNNFTGGGALNLVTNPYPSPIDWQAVRAASSNITDYYTYWDPNTGSRGGFVTVSSTETGSLRYIQPGQAFFVESNGGIPSVIIQESHKASGNNNEIFRTTTPSVQAFPISLNYYETSGYRRLVDNIEAWFDNSYHAAVDPNDAKEINNWDENIAILREGKRLSIEQRPMIINRDTLPIFINNMKQREYEFEFNPQLFSNTNLKAELIDNFLGTRRLLSVTDSTIVPFSITTDPASSASNRFMVVFGAFSPLAIDLITIKAQAKNDGVNVDWTSRSETDMDRYEVERSANGLQFYKQNTTIAIGNSSLPVNYTWFDRMPLTGNNFYRIKAYDRSGNSKYSPVVKVSITKDQSAINIISNPVTSNNIGLHLMNLDKGNYTLVLFNNLGQRIYHTQLKHSGGSAIKMISLNYNLPKGTYTLLLSGEAGLNMTTQIFKN